MEINVIPHKSRNKVVGMIIQRPHVQAQRIAGLKGCLLQVLRQQLILQESIRRALIHQYWRSRSLVCRHQLRRIVSFAFLDGAKVAFEGLLAPRALGRVANWRKGRGRSISSWILQVANESAMASH